ncbi:tRNA(Ile)-lysidine synthetase [Paenibacillus curdlanolyticus YK9]|uniref:tRNA(Ile)-lysidine synthase n=1 Tax=Paenibacillus curdlanolyticus YK9 TaxID=717606 RepID=E0I8Y9_9BACL|nr:tRNA lysidine(34) synthetase TilS [Paenibacillus curdlanolyticus]EFM10873.1 tRNA(Ile)-lysidine synthetase [Paenibacillus curdlanolyticus YK9]
MDEWMKQLIAARDSDQLWQQGDTIVIAVSGGPDSMMLLHLMHRIATADRLKLVAAHVDHGFRGAESTAEGEQVRAFAEQLGIAFEAVKLDMPTYIEETGMNGQLASRLRRYEFLHQVASRHGANRIALAHHADDQAETVLMRMLRGAGAGGLAGIQPKRLDKNVELIRPLLRMYKTDIFRYISQYEIPYAMDSSNEKRDYFRNEIRLDVMPYLAKYNPQLPVSLNRLAELASAEDQWMNDEASRVFKQLVTCSKGMDCELHRADFAGLPVALQRRLIKLILDYLALETAGMKLSETVDFDRIESMRTAALASSPTTWRMDAGSGVVFVRTYDVLRWSGMNSQRLRPCSPYMYVISGAEGILQVPEGGMSFRLTLSAAAAERGPYHVAFDADQLMFPLSIRNRRPGDRMRVIGLNGTKKVQDMFVDLKVPSSDRDRIPLLVDAEGQVLWIPGARRSAIAPIGAATVNVLRVHASPIETNIE